MRVCFLIILFLVINISGFSQSANLWENRDLSTLIQRYRIASGSNNWDFHSSSQYWAREDLVSIIGDSSLFQSEKDKFNQEYLITDNNEFFDENASKSKKPVLGILYENKADFYAFKSEKFDLHFNPVLHFKTGMETAADPRQYLNTRGVRVRGTIDGKVSFFSYIGENQLTTPQYVRDYRRANRVLPQEGFFKGFRENSYDFFEVRGYIKANITESIDVQFGRDNNRIGNGYRSMILSDFTPSYLFLKFNTNVWKINYTNTFAQLTQDVIPVQGGLAGFNSYPLKYLSLHHLSINLFDNFNLGFFEAVVYGSTVHPAQPQLKYLNPIIFYRAVEHQNGSSDNVILGADMEWLVKPGLSFYGQFALDEFLLARVREGNGWWGNKIGTQVGVHAVDIFGIDNLDFKGEFNLARPYTYSHGTPYGSYTDYRQPLAHPLGANFREYLGTVTYQVLPKLTLHSLFFMAETGLDPAGENWGGNIFTNNQTRMQEEGNSIGQGINTNILYGSITASYMLKHNVFVDLEWINRNRNTENNVLDQSTNIFNLSLRVNAARRSYEF